MDRRNQVSSPSVGITAPLKDLPLDQAEKFLKRHKIEPKRLQVDQRFQLQGIDLTVFSRHFSPSKKIRPVMTPPTFRLRGERGGGAIDE
jgi:hypothetical protein